MERCPTEIWLAIFSFACVDDGSTGRAISLVSKFFYTTSKSIKLQSLAIRGVNQLSGLADILESSWPEHRAVRYLSVRVHPRDMNKRSASVEEGTILRVRGAGGTGARGAARNSGTHDKGMLLLSHILEMLAPTLRILHLSLPISSPSSILPLHLPSIVELHLTSSDMRGQYLALQSNTAQHSESGYPSLKRLRLGMLHHHDGLFGNIAQIAPGLAHLRFCIPEHTYFYRDLEKALGCPGGDGGVSESEDQLLPKTIEKVSVHMGPIPNARRCPGWASMYDETRSNLERIAQNDPRVTIVRR